MSRDGIAIALNALANASREPVSEADLLPILSTGDGPGHLVRALFGDCSFDTLDRLGVALGLSRDRVRQSYARAKARHGAANSDLDAEARDRP